MIIVTTLVIPPGGDAGPSPATAYIPMPPGTWYIVDPSTYIYDVIAITEIS
jgi:hypothetical protein